MPKVHPGRKVSPEAARALVVGSCPACGERLSGRQRACSGKCRAVLSRQRQEQARRERDAEVRGLLEAALRRLGEGVAR